MPPSPPAPAIDPRVLAVRSACSDYTPDQIITIWEFAESDRDYGWSKGDVVYTIGQSCAANWWGTPMFDPCVTCLTAVTDHVYGP